MAESIPALVTPEILTWARELDQITIEEIASMMKVPVEKIYAWENGTLKPTLRQAKDLAKKYRVPFVYFYLPDLPKKTKRIKKIDYRTLGNIGDVEGRSRELRWLERDIEDRRDAILGLYAEEEREPILFPVEIPYDSTVNIELFATEIRKLLGLTAKIQSKFRKADKALSYCIANLEKYDVLIFQAAKIEPSEMRGLSIAYDKFPIIVLNRKDETSARLFTLCHELVHIISKTSGMCNNMTDSGNENIEFFCNNVAGLALVPTSDLLKSSHVSHMKLYGMDDISVNALSRDFAVSKQVIIRRLLDINLITKKQYFETLQRYTDEYIQHKKKDTQKGFLPPAIDKGTQVGKLYTKTVMTAYHDGKISALDASHYLLNLGTQHFSKIEGWCY